MTPAIIKWVLLLHAFSTIAMTGLIWFVQIVHYPLMRFVGASQFVGYEAQHTHRTTLVVGPLMLIECSTAAALISIKSAGPAAAFVWIGAALLVLVWLSTALLQVPCHRRLQAGFDAAVHARLVRTNWVRTVAWSARTVIAIALLTNGLTD